MSIPPVTGSLSIWATSIRSHFDVAKYDKAQQVAGADSRQPSCLPKLVLCARAISSLGGCGSALAFGVTVNSTPPGWSKLSPKERGLYSCIIILWALAALGTSFFVCMGVAFISGIFIAYSHQVGGDWVDLVPAIAYVLTAAAWIIHDRRTRFAQRSALAVVNRWKRKAQ